MTLNLIDVCKFCLIIWLNYQKYLYKIYLRVPGNAITGSRNYLLELPCFLNSGVARDDIESQQIKVRIREGIKWVKT